MPGPLHAALCQLAPVVLDRAATLAKVEAALEAAVRQGARLVCFGETLVPAYPFWLSRTGGARFDDPGQKALHARYLDQAVDLSAGHLDGVAQLAREHGAWVVLGVAERARTEAGGHTLYASAVSLGPQGVASVHRKLRPTHEERLSWGPGDGHGLRVHDVGAFRVGALNCWENWMPLARAALHAQGESVHVALWPGSERLTREITPFLAREGRSYVLSVGSLLRSQDLPPDLPLRDEMLAGEHPEAILYDGGTCVAGPDGRFLVEPVTGTETTVHVELEPTTVREERQNFDPSGHYARPDVFCLTVDRRRQAGVLFTDGSPSTQAD